MKTNFGGLVLGCTNADLLVKILILQRFSRSTRLSKWISDFYNLSMRHCLCTVFSFKTFLGIAMIWNEWSNCNDLKWVFSSKSHWNFIGISRNDKNKDYDESDTKSSVFWIFLKIHESFEISQKCQIWWNIEYSIFR